jgi:WD40 repeat protein
LLIGGDKRPQLWDIATGVPVGVLAGHTDEVYAAAFDDEGRLILTGSGFMHARGAPPEDGNAVRIWDAASGRELLSYRSADGPITAVSFGADDTTILAGSQYGALRRYSCEACARLPVLRELVATRLARPLSAQERARYVPGGGMLGWLISPSGG